MEIGSIWNKWDLHIHTPASFQNDYKFQDNSERKKCGNDIWEKFIYELEQIDDVPVIGITDYYSIEGYKRIKQYQNDDRLSNFKLILPNIEFRSSTLVSRKNSNKKMNFHVIFSDKLSIKEIEEEFLESLNIQTPDGEPRRLNKSNIENIGKELRDRDENLRSLNNDYFIGAMNIYVDLDEIIKILEEKKSIFERKYLIVLSEELWSELKWEGQDHLIRKQFFYKCNALFSSNPNTIDWALGKKDDFNNFLAEFGRPKPCIKGSDAHNFETLCNPDLNRFCWIKADCTFEGLRQIIYEPYERVKISENNPKSSKNIYSLSEINVNETFIDDKLTIDQISLPFNRNLITIIGGKGTGKTAILDVITNSFIDQCFRNNPEKKRENSFIQRIENIAVEMNSQVKFIDSEVGIFEKRLTEEKFFEKSKISYLPQGEIERFCGNEDQLEEKIREIIFNNKDVIDSDLIVEHQRLLKEINTKEMAIGSWNLEIYNLEKSTSNEIIREINKKKSLVEGDLVNKKKLLKEFIEHHNLEEEGEVQSLREQENKLKIEHSDLMNLKIKLEDTSKIVKSLVKTLNESIKEVNRLMEKFTFSFDIPFILNEDQIEAISKAENITDMKISEKITEINTKSTQISQLNGLQKEQSEIIKEIDELKNFVWNFDNNLQEIEDKKKRIKGLEESRKKQYFQILKTLFELKNCYSNIISLFSKGKNEILDEVDFQPKISLNLTDCIEKANDLFHGKKVKDDDLKLYEENLVKLINDENEIETNVNAYLNFIIDYKNKIKQSRNHEDFYNFVFLNPYKILTDVFYNERSMEKLSIGQKGTVLLKLMLAEGDYPLLIDQPEENLDNNFIYNDLVKAIRDAKKKRQIFLAPHNANLVVNTDAEQIIVANYIDNKIFYKSGSIENPVIKKEITSLLEGGEEAFKKREEKYGF